MDVIKQLDDKLTNALGTFVQKPTLIRGVVHLLLILYAARLAPTLPKPVLTLFDNAYFKLFIFSLILWTAQFSPSTSVLIAIAFLVSTNFINNKPLWEFLENVDPTSAPTAPTKDVAVDAAVATVNSQSQNSSVVTEFTQKQETVMIQPTIVDTPQGPTVVNPTVVVAEAVVTTPNGEQIIVRPDVTLVNASVPTQAPEPAPTEAPTQAPVQTLTQAPTQAPSAPAPAPEPTQAPTQEQSGCYPIRRYDMTKVLPFESGLFSTV